MLYTVTLFMNIIFNGYEIILAEEGVPVFSTVPVVECFREDYLNEVTHETRQIYTCKTERLYYQMTGQNVHTITVDGVYKS